jgi:aminoglycoside phosphotransferase (APT) family kinase protein
MAEPLSDFDGLLRWGPLQDWVMAQSTIPGAGPVTSARSLAGGSQNNLFLLTRDGAQFVIRRPPRHPRPTSDETMLREGRVLQALAQTNVPHPALYAVCADTEIIGTAFYVTAFVDGFMPVRDLPERYASEPAWRRRIPFECIEGAVRLGAIDYGAVGLENLGKPGNWLERQVVRWRSQLEGYTKLDGYDRPQIPRFGEIARWLEQNRPADYKSGLLHGDYHLSNVMFRYDAPELAAIVDWELCTVGDPMLDLGMFLVTWQEPTDPPRDRTPFSPWEPAPSRADLIAHYGSLTGRDMSVAPWYYVLACYKLGVILEGTHARASAGLAPKDTGDRLHATAIRVFEMAYQVARKS